MFDKNTPTRACGRALLVVAVAASAFACAAPAGASHDTGVTSTQHGSIETVTATPELDPWVGPVVERWAAATGRSWTYHGASAEDVGANFHVAVGEPPE